MISKFFIDRPVLANVLAIVMVVVGAVALYTLPVAQYPNVVPPTVSVTTRYPGASASTVMNTVALPIEQQVNGVQGMLYMQSTSASDGTYTLIVTFAIGTDLNFAQVLVQNRVSAAMASLPQQVQLQGVTVQQKSTSILEIIALRSPDASRDSLYLSNSHMARSGRATDSWIDTERRDPSHSTAEPTGHSWTNRHAPGATRAKLSVHGKRRGKAGGSGRIRQHHRENQQC